MTFPPIELTRTSLGGLFLAASARYEQQYHVAQAAWEMLFDDNGILPDHPLPELVDYLVDRAALSADNKAAYA